MELLWEGAVWAEIALPTQFGKLLGVAILSVIAVCTIVALIKIGMGFKHWVYGEDALGEIKSGFLIAGVPWVVQALFNGLGIYERLNISLTPHSEDIPDQVRDMIQYGLWIVVAIFLSIAIFVGIEGARKTSRGEDGMRQILGALGIAAAPFLMIAAFKLGGFWDGLGLKFI